MIVPSKQCLLIASNESKEFFLFDPKTTAVLQKFRDQTYISSLTYYSYSQQILAQQKNKTFMSVWNSDSLQVQLKISLNEAMSCIRITQDNHYLLGGSNNGNLYFWQLPGGILLKKHSIHSQQIKEIIQYKNNYFISSSLNQVKLWPLSNIFLETDNSTAKKTYQSINEIIAIAETRNILALLTHKTLTFLHISLESSSKQFEFIHKMDYEYATTLCLSKTLAFVGDAKGNVEIISLFPNEQKNQIAFRLKEGTKQLEISKPKVKKVLNSGCKHPISAVTYVQSLNYLIAGYTSGQVSIFSNYQLKKTLHLFKTSISEIKSIKKPTEIKIYQSQKICPLNKYEMGKEQQLLQIIPQIYTEQNDTQDNTLSIFQNQSKEQTILQNMLKAINQPERVMKQEIEQLRNERKLLLESNLHYFKLLTQ